MPSVAFLHFMREAWRVGKPGASLKVLLPHPRHDIFLNDPTHVQAVMPATLFGFSKKHLAALRTQGIVLTDFTGRLGVDFDLGATQYHLDPSIDKNDPELEWKMKHCFNIVSMWGTTLTVVK